MYGGHLWDDQGAMHSLHRCVPTHLHPSIVRDAVGDEYLQTFRSNAGKAKDMCPLLHSSAEKPPALHLIIIMPAVAIKGTVMTSLPLPSVKHA